MDKIRFRDGGLEKAELTSLKKSNDTYILFAKKGEPKKYYETIEVREKWWRKPVKKHVIKTSDTEVYDDDMLVCDHVYDDTILGFLDKRQMLRDIWHKVEIDNVWYNMAYVRVYDHTGDSFVKYFDNNEDAIEFFENLKQQGLVNELVVNN